MPSFKELGLSAPYIKAVDALGFTEPTEIQQKAIPLLLEGATDLIALAQTGTGKTAAFGLPLLQNIETASRKTQGLILAPTRELCLQITKDLTSFSKFEKGLSVVAIYGGSSIQEQARSLKKGAQIIVATPGRMKDMIKRGLAQLGAVEYCILDEADEMLNMGFYEDLTDILSHTPKDKSTWLFSATMPEAVARISRKFMHQPEELTVGSKNTAIAAIRHEYYLVGGRDRYAGLRRLADANPGLFSVIFCRTKRDTQKIAEKLIEDGYNAGAIHGDLSQQQRDLVMTAFRNRQLQLLVATDVAARGIDVADITHVIHYQLPDEIETYTHRSGRTGRAGKSGVSMVLLTRSEQRRIRGIERIIGRSFERKDLPSGEEICEIQLYHLAETLRNTDENPAVEAYLPAVQDLLEGLDRDALIRKLVAVEFSRFHDFYSRTQDPKPVREDAEDSKRERASASARFFINVGERDGLDWMILKDLIRESLGVSKKQVFRVETKDSFSFFSTEAELATKVLEHFQGLTFNGREVKVEPTGQDEKASRRPGKSGYTGKSSYTGKSGYKGKKKGGKPYQKASGKKYGKGNKHKSRR